jgi:Domain of unknown function (DUF1905)
MAPEHRFQAVVWEYQGGQGSWHFISLPADVADAIADEVGDQARGFGSVRVDVRIGGARWQTSLFPDRARGTYLLPLKKAVRDAEGLSEGTTASVRLRRLEAA